MAHASASVAMRFAFLQGYIERPNWENGCYRLSAELLKKACDGFRARIDMTLQLLGADIGSSASLSMHNRRRVDRPLTCGFCRRA